MKTALVKIEGYHCSMLRAFESLLTQNYSSFILTAINCFGVSNYDTSHNRGQRPQARAISSIGAVPMMWGNFSILKTNCAIACSTHEHMLRGFLARMSRREMASEIPETSYAFDPPLNAFMSVGIVLK